MEKYYQEISLSCFVCGFLSILGSIAIWVVNLDDPAHAERFGIFVGLWAPTFFSLSLIFKRV